VAMVFLGRHSGASIQEVPTLVNATTAEQSVFLVFLSALGLLSLRHRQGAI